MSILSERTERTALKAIAKTLRFFEELNFCQMTAEDEEDAAKAKSLLSGIIESEGYHAVYERRKGTKLIKEKRT
jgi:hypothetical protein